MFAKRLEIASESYKKEIDPYLAELGAHSQTSYQFQLVKFLYDKTFECYFQLHDWEEYLDWHAAYQSSATQSGLNEAFKQQIENRLDLNYIKALSSFEAHDLEAAKTYCSDMTRSFNLVDNLTICNKDDLEAATLKEIFLSVVNKK